MWPRFDSSTRRHMWVEFVGSLLCTERFSPATLVSPLLKNQHLTLSSILLFLGHLSLIKNKTQTTVTFENVCRAHTKRQVMIKMNKFNMFITAVCLIFDQTFDLLC